MRQGARVFISIGVSELARFPREEGLTSSCYEFGTISFPVKNPTLRPRMHAWKGDMANHDTKILAAFDEAMLNIYERALTEAGYRASRFLEMLHVHRGLETARILIHSSTVSEGYTALWHRKRLDLTVEAVILGNPAWHSLFTPDELDICRRRLTDYGYPVTV